MRWWLAWSTGGHPQRAIGLAVFGCGVGSVFSLGDAWVKVFAAWLVVWVGMAIVMSDE